MITVDVASGYTGTTLHNEYDDTQAEYAVAMLDAAATHKDLTVVAVGFPQEFWYYIAEHCTRVQCTRVLGTLFVIEGA